MDIEDRIIDCLAYLLGGIVLTMLIMLGILAYQVLFSVVNPVLIFIVIIGFLVSVVLTFVISLETR